MTAADKRMEELLDRWMASLELHTRYLKLDDAAYAQAEAWPKHQRPTKWVIDLARQRLIELRAHLTKRQQAGDVEEDDAPGEAGEADSDEQVPAAAQQRSQRPALAALGRRPVRIGPTRLDLGLEAIRRSFEHVRAALRYRRSVVSDQNPQLPRLASDD